VPEIKPEKYCNKLSSKLFISLKGFKRILSGSLGQEDFLTEYITFQSSLTQMRLFTQASQLVMNLSTGTSKQWPKASKVWELLVQSQGQSGIQLCFSWSSIICFWINRQNYILHSDTTTEMPTMIIIILRHDILFTQCIMPPKNTNNYLK